MRLFEWLRKKGKHKHSWQPRRTMWPYLNGYTWWCEECNTVIDFTPTKKELLAMGKPT